MHREENTPFVHHVPSVSSLVFHMSLYIYLKGISGSQHTLAMVITHFDMVYFVISQICDATTMWSPASRPLVSFTI